MIQLFIPSKDRACQLNLLLESIERNCPIFHITVLHTHSTYEFSQGYEKLRKKWKDVEWVFETDLRDNYLEIIRKSKSELFCHICDDCVFYRKFTSSYDDIIDLFDEKTICFSFRYGVNTKIQEYKTQRSQRKQLQNYLSEGDLIKWKWVEYPPLENNSFIFGQDGHTFRTGQWLDILESVKFSSLASLESYLTMNQRHYMEFPFMISPKLSCVVSIPTNSVQGQVYHSKENHVSTEELNERFLKGETISLDEIMKNDIVGAHQDIPLKFKGENN